MFVIRDCIEAVNCSATGHRCNKLNTKCGKNYNGDLFRLRPKLQEIRLRNTVCYGHIMMIQGLDCSSMISSFSNATKPCGNGPFVTVPEKTTAYA